MPRPRYNPRPDENHSMVKSFMERISYTYQGMNIKLIDTSKHAGVGDYLDYIIVIEPLAVWLEVKTPEAYAAPGHGLTPDEQKFFDDNPMIPKEIIATEQDLADALAKWVVVAQKIIQCFNV